MTTLTYIDDTVRMPWQPSGDEEIVVRPVLGILYRLALGAMAGAWVPRFLRYERDGRAAIRWHWPAFLFPAVWAFYRKLWVTGGLMAALPFGFAALYAWIDPAMRDSPMAWLVLALVVVWGLPGALAALAADSLLYRRVRNEVQDAEAALGKSDEVAALLTARRRTAPFAALALGTSILALLVQVTLPELGVLYEQHVVRANVAAGIAAVAPLQRQVEEQWQRTGSLPRTPDYAAVEAQQGAAFLDHVDLNILTGRVRLALGPAIGSLAGKALLLAPALDPQQRIYWFCFAVDVPAQYLPANCRRV
jgi:Pilin (bacterial filament)/Protein of unknown function (DUF2628)